MKKSALPTPAENTPDYSYKRSNTTQIRKVRCFIRESKYLLEPNLLKEHTSIDKTSMMSSDLVRFSSIAVDNIKNYVESKVNNVEVKITLVFVTHEEQEEANCIENKSIKDIQILIYKKMENLESSHLQEEIFEKTVRNKSKSKYIEFFYKLCEIVDTQRTLKLYLVVKKMKNYKHVSETLYKILLFPIMSSFFSKMSSGEFFYFEYTAQQ